MADAWNAAWEGVDEVLAVPLEAPAPVQEEPVEEEFPIVSVAVAKRAWLAAAKKKAAEKKRKPNPSAASAAAAAADSWRAGCGGGGPAPQEAAQGL